MLFRSTIEDETSLEALNRELGEELGITAIAIREIPTDNPLSSPKGKTLNPFLISDYDGIIPSHIIDTQSPIIKIPPSEALQNSVETTRLIAIAAIKLLST